MILLTLGRLKRQTMVNETKRTIIEILKKPSLSSISAMIRIKNLSITMQRINALSVLKKAESSSHVTALKAKKRNRMRII